MKKKKAIIIVVSIISLLLVGTSIGIYCFVKSKVLKVSLDNNAKVEINTKVYNIDYIKNVKNGTIITKKKEIDTSKLGKQKISIKIKDHFKKIKEFTYQIEIIDTEKPKIEFTDKISITEGTKVDLLKDVKATDNSKEEIKVTVEGDYDFNKPGTYELHYVAKDSSGNEEKEKFTLEVKKKPANNNPSTGYVQPDTTFTTSKGFNGYVKNGITYIDGILIANKTYSLPSSYNPGALLNETMNAFNQMKSDASAVGLNIYVVSGFRSYNDQNIIYNNYVANDGKANADTYSARPGHSEHQSGLAFDLNWIDNAFENTAEGKWLNNNAHKYGFVLRYPKGKTNETGYIFEPWHFRYVGKDLAEKLYNNGDWITVESYFGITSQYNY